MVCGDEVPGAWGEFVSGYVPDIASLTFFECGTTFDEWLAVYFLECSEDDRPNTEMLSKYPDM
mgnify:FL=1